MFRPMNLPKPVIFAAVVCQNTTLGDIHKPREQLRGWGLDKLLIITPLPISLIKLKCPCPRKRIKNTQISDHVVYGWPLCKKVILCPTLPETIFGINFLFLINGATLYPNYREDVLTLPTRLPFGNLIFCSKLF